MAPSSLFLHFMFPLLLLSLQLASPSHAQSHQNISLGSSLTPLGRNTSWLSPSGEFAFGFHPLETDRNLFLLAIWFEKTANKTLVWYANGDEPVQDRSRVELTTDGQFLLKDHNGQVVWDAGRFNSASYAAMLDTGNFVLVSPDTSVLWQSFDAPADTILPSQVLGLNTTLQARLTDTDYSRGRFKLRLQDDGNLVLYTLAVPSGNQYDPYWASDTVRNGSKLVFNESGRIYLALKNGSLFNFTSVRLESMKDFYHRATLDSDGVFKQYVYPRNLASGGAGRAGEREGVGLGRASEATGEREGGDWRARGHRGDTLKSECFHPNPIWPFGFFLYKAASGLRRRSPSPPCLHRLVANEEEEKIKWRAVGDLGNTALESSAPRSKRRWQWSGGRGSWRRRGGGSSGCSGGGRGRRQGSRPTWGSLRRR